MVWRAWLAQASAAYNSAKGSAADTADAAAAQGRDAYDAAKRTASDAANTAAGQVRAVALRSLHHVRHMHGAHTLSTRRGPYDPQPVMAEVVLCELCVANQLEVLSCLMKAVKPVVLSSFELPLMAPAGTGGQGRRRRCRPVCRRYCFCSLRQGVQLDSQ